MSKHLTNVPTNDKSEIHEQVNFTGKPHTLKLKIDFKRSDGTGSITLKVATKVISTNDENAQEQLLETIQDLFKGGIAILVPKIKAYQVANPSIPVDDNQMRIGESEGDTKKRKARKAAAKKALAE